MSTAKTWGPGHPSNLDQFLAAPTPFLARVLYSSLPARRRQPAAEGAHGEETLTVVCVSDTHGRMPSLPMGDLLLHSGGLTVSGTAGELEDTLQWIASQPHRYKVVIAGHRELCLDEQRGRSLGTTANGARDEKVTAAATATATATTAATIDWEKLSAAGLVYLQSSSITLHFPAPRDRCVKIFGSPLSSRRGPGAFQCEDDEQPWEGVVPVDTDIVMTHTPPQCHLDSWRMLGCVGLLQEMWRVRPALHVFGRIHAGYGVEVARWDEMQRLYEGACGGGKWALARMAAMFVWCWISHGLFKGRWDRRLGETRLVNASVGKSEGERDLDLAHEPIVVHL